MKISWVQYSFVAVALIIFFMPYAVQGAIHRFVDERGRVYYTDDSKPGYRFGIVDDSYGLASSDAVRGIRKEKQHYERLWKKQQKQISQEYPSTLNSDKGYASNISGSTPNLKKYVSTTYHVSVGFPSHWSLDKPFRNEIWLSVGELRGNNAACFVRVSEVEYLRLSTPEEFFAQMDEKAFIKLNSIGMPDINIHLYDMAYLSGRKARRAAYSGTDSGIKTGTITYQALDGDRIFTVGCLSEASTFLVLFNDFEAVISSFRFRK